MKTAPAHQIGLVDLAGGAKVFIWREVILTRRVTLTSKKGDPAVTFLAESTFLFL